MLRPGALVLALCLAVPAFAGERWAVLPVGHFAPDPPTAESADRLLLQAAESIGAEAGAHVLTPGERDAAMPALARVLGVEPRVYAKAIGAEAGLDRVVQPTFESAHGLLRLRLDAFDGQTSEALGTEAWAAETAPGLLALIEAQGPEALRRLLTGPRESGVPVRIVYSGVISRTNGRMTKPGEFGVRARGRVFPCPAMTDDHLRCTISRVPPGPAELVAWTDDTHRIESSVMPIDVPPTGLEVRLSSGGIVFPIAFWASTAIYAGMAVADVRSGGALSPPAALRDLPPGGYFAVGAGLVAAISVPLTVMAGDHLEHSPLPAFVAAAGTSGGDPAQFVLIRSHAQPDVVLDVGLEGPFGTRACRDGLSFGLLACRLHGLAPGPATIHVATGGRTFSRPLVLTAEPQEITVSYEPAPVKQGLTWLGVGALTGGFGWLAHYGAGDGVKVGWAMGILGGLFAIVGVKDLVLATGADEPTIEVRPLDRDPATAAETTTLSSLALGPTATGDGAVLSAAFTFR